MLRNPLGGLTGAPLWAYGLLAYSLWVGIQNTKRHTLWLPKLLIAPIVLISLFLVNIFRTYGLNPIALGLYLAAILVGLTMGWLFTRRTILIVDKTQHLITLPGSLCQLALIASYFCNQILSRLYGSYPSPFDPNARQLVSFQDDEFR